MNLLSEDWLAYVNEQATALPEVPGVSLVMQHVVSGTPTGKVQCGVEVRDGRLVACAIGKRPDATCTVTWTYADAARALAGDTDLDVAFMRGDLKVDGDYRRFLLDLRRLFATPEGAAFLTAVRAATAT